MISHISKSSKATNQVFRMARTIQVLEGRVQKNYFIAKKKLSRRNPEELAQGEFEKYF